MSSTKYECAACGEPIMNDLIIKDALPYHSRCIKCMLKGCPISQSPDDLITIQPGLFFCMHHYTEYKLRNMQLPSNVTQKYKEVSLETLIEKTFEPPPVMKNSISFDNQTEIFLPTIELHFDEMIEHIDIEEFKKFIGDEFEIVNVERGSFIATIAWVAKEAWDFLTDEKCGEKIDKVSTAIKNIEKISDDIIKPAYEKIIKPGYENFVKPIGQSIINFFKKVKENAKSAFAKLKEKFSSKGQKYGTIMQPTIEKYPDPERIQAFINNNSNDILQMKNELSLNQYCALANQASNYLKKKNNNITKWFNIMKDKKKLNAEAEKHLGKIEKCPFEVVIINKYFTDYPLNKDYYTARSKYQIDEIEENYLYHGCYSNNELKRSEDFIMPSDRLYFKGYYATDSLFYAAFFGNEKFHPLDINEKAFVSVCKTFYNKDYEQLIFPLPDLTYQSILENDGVIEAIIGDTTNNFLPIDQRSQPNSGVFSKQYIFGNNNQLLHLYTVEVIRRDYYVLWKDANINKNDKKVIKLRNDISQDANLYIYNTTNDAIPVIRRKKANRFKIITDHDPILIQSLREIFEDKKLLVLVYTKDTSCFEIYNKMGGVLVTTSSKMVREFVKAGFDIQSLNQFIGKLEEKEHFVFENIDREQMSDFNQFIDKIPFDEHLAFKPK